MRAKAETETEGTKEGRTGREEGSEGGKNITRIIDQYYCRLSIHRLPHVEAGLTPSSRSFFGLAVLL